ncbi:MAG: LysR family transcriptional regulator [Verrucomicrobiales bacterium]
MFENLFAQRGLSLDRLKAFLETAEAGGITRAVGSDPVKQSQYSRQISELESFFGTRLMQRRGRRLELTITGRELATVVRAHFRGLESFQQSLANKPVEMSLGAGDSILTWLIIPSLPCLRKRFPNLMIRLFNLRSTAVVERLAEFQLDLGVVRPEILSESLGHQSLGKVGYRLYVASALMAGRMTALSYEDILKNVPLVTLGSDGEFMRRLRQAADKHKMGLQISLVTESFPQAARAVCTGHYAGILPVYAATELEGQGVVSLDHPMLRAVDRRLVLAWNPKLDRLRFDMEEFRKALVEELAASLGKRKNSKE